MYKYKNISDLRQSVTVNGKRVLMMPNDVIESSREMKFVFLESVDDNVEVSVGTSAAATKISAIRDKLERSSEENKTYDEEIKKLNKKIDDISESKTVDVNDGIQKQLDDLLASFNEYKATTNKRLGMLKGALMTVQQDLYEVEFDEDGKVVDEEYVIGED